MDASSPSAATTPRQARRRSARGPARPSYLNADDIDHMLAMILALTSEVSSLRERLDTHERLAGSATPATAAAVEAYALDDAGRAAREQTRQGMLGRVLRVLADAREAAGARSADFHA